LNKNPKPKTNFKKNGRLSQLSASDKEWQFTDNAGKPQIRTNHALYKYPDTSAFPQVPATDEYGSYNRYRRLDNYVTNHEGKFSPDDASSSMALVYANTALAMGGGSPPLPLKTGVLWYNFTKKTVCGMQQQIHQVWCFLDRLRLG
jgi:hypothetical protein